MRTNRSTAKLDSCSTWVALTLAHAPRCWRNEAFFRYNQAIAVDLRRHSSAQIPRTSEGPKQKVVENRTSSKKMTALGTLELVRRSSRLRDLYSSSTLRVRASEGHNKTQRTMSSVSFKSDEEFDPLAVAPTSRRGSNGMSGDDAKPLLDLSAPHPRMLGSSLPAHADLERNGWKLVRHCPARDNWHPAEDRLRGTAK